MSNTETIYTRHPDSAPWAIDARIVPYLQLARLYDFHQIAYGRVDRALVTARDGNGYWTRPVSVFTDLGPKNIDPSDSGRIRILLNFTGPDPDLRKKPDPDPQI